MELLALPTVTTDAATAITHNSATLNATLNSTGGLLTVRYFEYGTTSAMTESSGSLGGTTSPGSYSYNLTGLTPDTTYYFRARVVNEDGVSVGLRRTFKTASAVYTPPSVTTLSATSITQNAAIIRGNLTSTGGTSTARYFRYGTTTAMTSSVSKGATTSTGEYTHVLSNLEPNTTYYFEAYAINSEGSSYGGRLSFKTAAAPVIVAPTVSTGSASSIGETSATVSGSVTDTGGENPVRFIRWGPTTSMTNTENCGSGGTGSYSVTLSGLTPDTTYYYEAYAINSGGTGTGTRRSFKTAAPSIVLPSVDTLSANNITDSSATIRGYINSTGGENPYRYIQWGLSTSTMNNIYSGGRGGVGAFSTTISGLDSNTTYYFRAYAENSAGRSYGSILSFTTKTSRPSNWEWNSTELNAFNNRGFITALTASRWNAFVDRVNAFRAWKGLSAIGGKGSNNPFLDHNNFNTVRNGIQAMITTGVPTVAEGDICRGSYFVTLAEKLNQIT